MAVLVLGEVTDGVLGRDATAKTVTAVAPLGAVTVLCAGARAAEAAAEAATIAGVAKVLVAEDALYGHRLAEPVAALIVSLAGDYSHIAAPATTAVATTPAASTIPTVPTIPAAAAPPRAASTPARR